MADSLNYGRLFASKIIDNASTDDIFTLSSGVLRNLVICVANQTGSAVTLDAYVVPSAGSPAAANQFLKTYSISANSFEEIPVPKMIGGDKLTLQAGTATALAVFDADSVVRV